LKIIRRKNRCQSFKDDAFKGGFSFIIDIAEIWELYLKTLLKRRLSTEGWTIREDRINTYQGKYYLRQPIPGIVLRKNKDVMAWDAKYKRMLGTKDDYDRTDYFQIHTYMHYYQQRKNTIACGLLYPISVPKYFENRSKFKSTSLFESGSSKTQFVADRIDLSFMHSSEQDTSTTIDTFKRIESDSISRIKQLL
jgi:5-methylcytosine-specific restriction endonuclease McrBC regulatory subunit McrC